MNGRPRPRSSQPRTTNAAARRALATRSCTFGSAEPRKPRKVAPSGACSGIVINATISSRSMTSRSRPCSCRTASCHRLLALVPTWRGVTNSSALRSGKLHFALAASASTFALRGGNRRGQSLAESLRRLARWSVGFQTAVLLARTGYELGPASLADRHREPLEAKPVLVGDQIVKRSLDVGSQHRHSSLRRLPELPTNPMHPSCLISSAGPPWSPASQATTSSVTATAAPPYR